MSSPTEPSPTDPSELEHDLALRSAGRRAAQRPVMIGPPVDAISHKAQRLRTRRRMLGTSAVLVLLAGLAVPLNLALRSEASVQMVAAGTTTDGEGAAMAPPAAAASSAQPPNPDGGDGDEPAEPFRSGRLELRFGDEIDLAVTVLGGPEALAAAADAEADAIETRYADGTPVWVLAADDGRTTVAAAIDDGYIEVTGPSDQIDRLIGIIEDGSFDGQGHGMPPAFGFDDGELEQFFEQLPGRFGEGGPFHFEHDGEFHFDFDSEGIERFFEGLPEHFGEGEFHSDFDSGELERFFEGLPEHFGEGGPFHFDFDSGELERFFEGLPERFGDGEFHFDFDSDDIAQFFEGLPEHFVDGGFFGEHWGGFGQGELDLCLRLELDGEEPFELEHPEGCSTG